ncbi:MAG: RsmB/NOP family class I SAM-dependent RNA methyltransferase, partial [Sulfolobus sp.]|nr:RsmB/NOP family class I SAM-dependent RNA methyltransferase [Sulfolobus sp.]
MMDIKSYLNSYKGIFEVSPTAETRNLAAKYGYLDYMIERYIRIFNEVQEVNEFLEGCEVPLIKSIRCNELKTSCNELEKRLRMKGYELERLEWLSYGYKVLKSPKKPTLGATMEYLQGFYHIQGIASMIPAHVLSPSPSDKVLDMAAAPGSKTSQLAQIMKNNGVILAVEKNRERIKSLLSNLNRLGVTNTVLLRADSRNLENMKIEFDKILLDAPCSGEGLIPIDKTRKTKTSIQKLYNFSMLQLLLIKVAYKLLREKGVLVYSTCSIGPEEDELVVNYAVEELGMKVEKVERV